MAKDAAPFVALGQDGAHSRSSAVPEHLGVESERELTATPVLRLALPAGMKLPAVFIYIKTITYLSR